ncbi:15275_t:CDS:2 [Funneliformis geosporum]|uniref:15275_t:CDS:1 n=1 Tax=Funneliformis geosporum TaxID=1117311 RepID=A0A9W4WT28_9GLOM|nr:15275_t:CDS:2 [Funneliformis geosporum]
MLKQIKEREFGEVNRLVNNLRKKTEEFLKKYSKSEKEAISALELVEKKKELEKDLSKEKSQLREIISTIKTLENEESESKTKYQICQEREKDLEIADYSNLDKLNISEDPQEESSIQVQIEIPPK